MEIAKAGESLQAAEYCCEESLHNSSVSRAYDSMYQVESWRIAGSAVLDSMVRPIPVIMSALLSP